MLLRHSRNWRWMRPARIAFFVLVALLCLLPRPARVTYASQRFLTGLIIGTLLCK